MAAPSSRYGLKDKPHLGVAEVADWFGSYVYLPKLRDRVVLHAAIRDAAGKLDPSFGFADRFDEAAGKYVGLVWAKSLPEIIPQSAVIVRSEVAFEHLRPHRWRVEAHCTGSEWRSDGCEWWRGRRYWEAHDRNPPTTAFLRFS